MPPWRKDPVDKAGPRSPVRVCPVTGQACLLIQHPAGGDSRSVARKGIGDSVSYDGALRG